jgi:hypothetical protein
MLKFLVLQKYHNLSDEQTEFQIGDRFSFMQFLGLQPGDGVPDERTIWDFKGLLDKGGRDFHCVGDETLDRVATGASVTAIPVGEIR